MQYHSYSEQKLVINNISNNLNKEGIAIITWPGNKNVKLYNLFLSNILSIIYNIPKEIIKKKHYSSLKEIEKIIKLNKNLKIEKSYYYGGFLLTGIKSWLERFKLNTTTEIEKTYSKFYKTTPNIFYKKKEIYLKSKLSIIVVNKI